MPAAMVRLGATIASSFALISCAVVAASGASQCPPEEAGLALVQTRSLDSKVTLEPASPIKSGDGIFLQVARTGKRLTAQEDGVVRAKWASTGTWEKFLIERKSGDGNVQSGDTIFLTAWTGNMFTVGDWQSGDFVATTVHAKWDHKGEWQTLSIIKEGAEGPIMDGDKVFLKSWTGAIVDSDAPDTAAGAVQARWDHMGSWQELVVEASDPEMGPAPAPPQQEQPAPAPPTPKEDEEGEVVDAHSWEHFQLANQLRTEGFTCPAGDMFAPNSVPLKFDCRLWKASKLHSEDMGAQNYFSHTSKDGRSPWERAEEQNTDAHGENIAAGSSNAAATLEQFKQSDGHCKNMMKASFKVMGVGYAHNSGSRFRHYWTQMYSLIDSTDTSCYPKVALLQRPEDNTTGDVQKIVLSEPWSREQP